MSKTATDPITVAHPATVQAHPEMFRNLPTPLHQCTMAVPEMVYTTRREQLDWMALDVCGQCGERMP